ncbi:hypothetical protein Gotur_033609, partial [Gossypium turneri]
KIITSENKKNTLKLKIEICFEVAGIAITRLINDDPHISDAANNMGSYRVLRGQMNGIGYPPDERLMPYLEQAGFGSAALIRTFDLRYDLISALVKRWRPETHTFHFPCGECTVTLEDVALQLGLAIDGSPVMGVSTFAEPAALCYSLLGDSPNDDESNFLGLKDKFGHLSANATEGELMCTVRAYIMHIIGGVLIPDSNNNKGSAVLAMLYRELCRTSKPAVVDMGGSLILLQSWALYRMSFLASIEYLSGYREVIHYPDIPSDDQTTCRGRVE